MVDHLLLIVPKYSTCSAIAHLDVTQIVIAPTDHEARLAIPLYLDTFKASLPFDKVGLSPCRFLGSCHKFLPACFVIEYLRQVACIGFHHLRLIRVKLLQTVPKFLYLHDRLVDLLSAVIEQCHIWTVTLEMVPELVMELRRGHYTLLELSQTGFISELRDDVHFLTTIATLAHIIIVLAHLKVAEDNELFLEGRTELVREGKLSYGFLLTFHMLQQEKSVLDPQGGACGELPHGLSVHILGMLQ